MLATAVRPKLPRRASLKRVPLKRVVSKPKARVKAIKRKKRTANDLKREWLIPAVSFNLRYKGLRGVYWYWLSRDVRKKEWEKWNGLCITCLLPIEDWRFGHCGHIIAAQNCGEFLRFNSRNLTIQHAACNSDRITPQASALNALHYDERYGKGAWDELYSLRKSDTKEPKQDEYRALIQELDSYKEAVGNQLQYQEKVKELG